MDTASCTMIFWIKVRTVRPCRPIGQHQRASAQIDLNAVLVDMVASLRSSPAVDRQFEVDAPDRDLVHGPEQWSSDIHQNQRPDAYLGCCDLDHFHSRRVVGWSMQSRMTTDLNTCSVQCGARSQRPRRVPFRPGLSVHQQVAVSWQTVWIQAGSRREVPSLYVHACMHCRNNNAVAESFF
jgi:hypothetical protein